jgi:hypothetical protein
MTFETQYQLDEFREIKDQYFDEDEKLWAGLIGVGDLHYIMEQMLKLIGQLTIEVGTLEYEIKGLNKELSQAVDAAGSYEQRAREAETEIRQILNDIER